MREAHGGGLSGHFGEKKTYELLKEYFFWPNMLRDVHKVIERCAICKKAKGKENAYEPYHCLFHSNHGWMLAWTLYLGYQEHSVERIQ